MMSTIRLTAVVLSLFFLFALPSFAVEKGDLCREHGITVRNATTLNLWYKKNGGECTIWIHEHLLTIMPGDTIALFSGMDCAAYYCGTNPTYGKYGSVDRDGNCRVRILPGCSLSDM